MLDAFVHVPEINLIEVYIVRGKKEYGYDVGWPSAHHKLMTSLQEAFGSGNKQELVEYIHRDMVYMFDRSDDRQKVYRKIALKEVGYPPFYAIGYCEENTPIHRFPCLSEVTLQRKILRTQIRVNNRMYIYNDIDEENRHTYMIRYQHASNVDTKKMDQDMERVMQIFKRSV